MITCYIPDQSPAELDGIVYNDARWWCFEILVTPRKGISESLRAFLLLSPTLIDLVHEYIMYSSVHDEHDNTIVKNSISAFLVLACLSRAKNEKNYTETGLIFILRSSLMMEGGCGERESDGERARWRTGVPSWFQTQMDKMRGEHKHSWGLAAWSIKRPGISEPSSALMTLALLPLSQSALSPGTPGTRLAEHSCIKIKGTFPL